MKKPTKTKAINAVKYWKSAGGSYLYPDKKAAQYFSGFQAHTVKPVAVLPVDAESVERMGEQIKKAWIDADESEHIDDMVKITLAAIGIKGGAK